MSSDPITVAEALTGDTIVAAGVFEPKGAAAKRGGGAAAGTAGGSLLGDAIGAGSIGLGAGALVGATAGHLAGNLDGVFEFLVAVGHDKVYILVARDQGGPYDQQRELRDGDVVLLRTFDRRHLKTTVKAHFAVRTMVLEDTATGEHLDLEGRRIGWTHAKAVIAALVTHEPEGD
jgi:hypothetical protein